MNWFNYKVPALNTPLSGPVIIPSELLPEIISSLNGQTLYHCFYDLEKRKSFVDYQGLMRPVNDTLHFDFDSDDGGKSAWEDTKRFCHWLNEQQCPFHLYFSGNKGFHVAVASLAFGVSEGPKEQIEAQVKGLVYTLKPVYPTLDTGIWNANRKFRAFRSLHEKSELYKIRLTGIGLRASELPIAEIRELARSLDNQPTEWEAPKYGGRTVALDGFTQGTVTPQPEVTGLRAGKKLKELPVGQMSDDESLKFKNFTDKKCISFMKITPLPQFNRHDIGLRLMTDCYYQGMSLEQTKTELLKWATGVFGEGDRVRDTLRQCEDIYTKPQEYQFSCYDPIKQAYCTAKCKLYDQLDRHKRAEVIDCNKRQQKENQARVQLNQKSEGELADEILSGLPTLVRCDGDYFYWASTHWERLDRDRFEEKIHTACIRAYENKAPNRILESLFNQIKKKLPVAPENNCLFKTSPNKFNFTDGTCHVSEDATGKVTLKMKPHNQADFISYCAPFPLYADHNLPRSEGHHFKHFMQAKAKHLGEANVRILKQMMGAALIPYRPKIFFLIGEKDSGKSTHAMLLMRLLGQKNISVIDPVREKGQRFTWEEAIGKIANFSLELPHDVPLDTNSLKKVRDKMELDIERKGIKKVRARLPFIHVYCANKMPPSLEGNSGALASRFIVVEYPNLGKEDLNGLSGIQSLAEHFWEFDAGAVLDWAREGLAELVESNFVYYTPESSRSFLKDWEMINDSVSQFLADCASGEFKLGPEDGAEGRDFELGKTIYKGYLRWAKEAGIKNTVKRLNFYRDLVFKKKMETRPHGDGGLRIAWHFPDKNLTSSVEKSNEKNEKNSDSKTSFTEKRAINEIKNEVVSGLNF